MEFRKRLAIERSLRKKWDIVRLKREELACLITGKKQLENKNISLLKRCVDIVCDNIFVNGEEFLKKSEELADIKKPTVGGEEESFVKFSDRLVEFLGISEDKATISEKLESLDRLRAFCWRNLVEEKEDIFKLNKNFPLMDDNIDILLLFKCVSMVVLELDMKDEEIKTLEKSKFT